MLNFKTHVKVSVLNETASELYQNRTSNTVLQTRPYHSYDVEGIWGWLKDQLSSLTRRFNIKAISIATHGAAAALINPGTEALLLPVMDYEYDAYPEDLPDYDILRPSVEETGSPKFPAGLNLGRQLHWQSHLLTDNQKEDAVLLMYPQYCLLAVTQIYGTLKPIPPLRCSRHWGWVIPFRPLRKPGRQLALSKRPSPLNSA